MIDPTQVTNYNRTRSELEEFVLFTAVVSGKRSSVQAPKLHNFLSRARQVTASGPDLSPLQLCHELDDEGLLACLTEVRMGQYTRLVRTIRRIATAVCQDGLDLKTAQLETLSAYLGLKTVRMFLLHTRPNAGVAVLDTHILSWLRAQGVAAPRATPSSARRYRVLEQRFLRFAAEQGVDPAELDLQVWIKGATPKGQA